MHWEIAATSQAISGNVGKVKEFTREMPQCVRDYLANFDNAGNAPGNCSNVPGQAMLSYLCITILLLELFRFSIHDCTYSTIILMHPLAPRL
jgi:hypothetical protein